MGELWSDKSGVTVNGFLRALARILFVLCPLFLVVGLFWWGSWGFDEIDFTASLGRCCIYAINCFFSAIGLLWLSTLGNNVAKIVRQSKSDNAQQAYSDYKMNKVLENLRNGKE